MHRNWGFPYALPGEPYSPLDLSAQMLRQTPVRSEELTAPVSELAPDFDYMQQSARPALSGLGDLGSAIRRLGSLAGLGTMDLVPGVTFQNDTALNDFMTGVQLHSEAGTWTGLPANVLTQLRQDITEANGSLDLTTISLVSQFTSTAQAYAAQLDNLEHWDSGLFGRSVTRDIQFKQTMDLFKNLILKFLQDYGRGATASTSSGSYAVPQGTQPATSTPSTVVPGAVDQLNQNVLAVLNQWQANQQAHAPAQAPVDSGFPWVPVLGAGALVLVGAFVLTRKKS